MYTHFNLVETVVCIPLTALSQLILYFRRVSIIYNMFVVILEERDNVKDN